MMMTGVATAAMIVQRLTLRVSVDRKKKIYIWESNGGLLDWFG